MRSTFGGLNTIVRGVNMHQLSLDTVGHNITNSNTPGYSRQRVNLATTRSQVVYSYYGASQLGTGADATSITRARDTFADQQYWKENSTTYYANSMQYSYNKLEAIFNEIEDTGLQTKLNDFWQSLKTLSTSASDYSTRVVTRDTGKQLTEMIQQYTGQIQDLIEDNNQQMELEINTVNELTKGIALLNKQIFQSEANGSMANDLRDSRDYMVDQLSEMLNVKVMVAENGMYSVSCDGNMLVNDDTNVNLVTQSSDDPEYGGRSIKIVMERTNTELPIKDGKLKGLQDAVTESKGYIDQMGKMANYLLTAFNDQHKAGFGLDDVTGVNFFGEDGTISANGSGSISYAYNAATNTFTKTDNSTVPPTNTTLNTIEIIKELVVNERFDETNGTDLIAAKTEAGTNLPSDGQDTASGDNAVKLGDILHTKSDSAVLGNVTLSAYYTGLIGKLGVDALAIDRELTNQEDIITQIETWRSSVAGVNWDEELSDMIRFQKGYGSCSRVLTAMDEMLDKLINSTGVVGR